MIFHTDFVDTFILKPDRIFHMPNSNGSLAITRAINPRTQVTLRMTAILFCDFQDIRLTKYTHL
jgi:hypothetical protein